MFPFWMLLDLRMMQLMVTNGTTRRTKLQSNCHHQQTNTQFFYRPDIIPAAEASKENVSLLLLWYKTEFIKFIGIKVLNFGIIFLSMIRKLNHCSLLSTKYKNLYYSLGFNHNLYLY